LFETVSVPPTVSIPPAEAFAPGRLSLETCIAWRSKAHGAISIRGDQLLGFGNNIARGARAKGASKIGRISFRAISRSAGSGGDHKLKC
jgi:hypothetical protein